MADRNDITGDSLRSRNSNPEAHSKGYDLIDWSQPIDITPKRSDAKEKQNELDK